MIFLLTSFHFMVIEKAVFRLIAKEGNEAYWEAINLSHCLTSRSPNILVSTSVIVKKPLMDGRLQAHLN